MISTKSSTDKFLANEVKSIVLAKTDSQTREKVVEQFTPLVHRMIRDYALSHKNSDYEDLVIEGQMGILEAIDDFDPAKGSHFMTYVFYKIRNRLSKFLKGSNLITASTFNNIPNVMLIREQGKNKDGKPQRSVFAKYNELSFNEEDFLMSEYRKELITKALERLENNDRKEIVRYLFGLGRPVKDARKCAVLYNFSVNYINIIKNEFLDILRNVVQEEEMER